MGLCEKRNAVGASLVGAPAMMGHSQRAAYRGETLHATSVQCFGSKMKCRRHDILVEKRDKNPIKCRRHDISPLRALHALNTDCDPNGVKCL